jgi:Na+/proline symporter
MAIGLGVLAFYSIAGGIIAGVYTDLFQGLLMVAASLLVFWTALERGGGMEAMSATLWAMDPEYVGPWGTRGALTSLSWFFLFAIGGVGQPHAITKFLMLRDVRRLKWGGLLAGVSYGLLSLLWMSVGLSMRVLVDRGVQTPLDAPDSAAPLFLLNYAPEWLAGMVFAGLLAAIMSTADSFLNIGAAALVRDIPTALRGRPLDHELRWTRVATGAILLGSALFALYMESLIALLGTFGWGTFAAAIVPSVAIGMNWKRATGTACSISIACSIVLNFVLELGARNGVFELPHGFVVGAFSLLVSTVVFVAVSLATPAQRLDDDVAAVIDL